MSRTSREPRPTPNAGHTGRDGLNQSSSKFERSRTTHQELHPGHFVLLCPKANKNELSALFGSLSSSLTLRGSFGSGRTRGGSIQARIDGLLNGWDGDNNGRGRTGSDEGGTGAMAIKHSTSTSTSSPTSVSQPLNSLTVNTHNPSPHTWLLGHSSAAVVNFGMFEVTAGISRMQPAVYFDGTGGGTTNGTANAANADPAFCVFQGYLSNLEELLERYDVGAIGKSTSRMTPGEKAAALLYAMVYPEDESSSSTSSDPLVVLSELQGQYAFVMYNSDRKQVFGARDSSGKERLFFELDDDNGVTVSNTKDVRVRGVDGVGWVVWEELQPGHYICGRPAKVNQFALTREEVKEREEFLERDDLSLSLGGLEI